MNRLKNFKNKQKTIKISSENFWDSSKEAIQTFMSHSREKMTTFMVLAGIAVVTEACGGRPDLPIIEDSTVVPGECSNNGIPNTIKELRKQWCKAENQGMKFFKPCNDNLEKQNQECIANGNSPLECHQILLPVQIQCFEDFYALKNAPTLEKCGIAIWSVNPVTGDPVVNIEDPDGDNISSYIEANLIGSDPCDSASLDPCGEVLDGKWDTDGDGILNYADLWPTCKGDGSKNTQCSIADQERLTIEWCK